MSSTLAEVVSGEQSTEGEDRQIFVDLAGDEPIRAEIYGLEHLEAHARQLAKASAKVRITTDPSPLRHFAQNHQALLLAHRRVVELSRQQPDFGPHADWLLDNFYIVEEALREVRQDLPQGYYAELPKLVAGPLAGYPRIHALALALIAHTDSSLDEPHIARFVQAYQTVVPLTIGELWAVPTMLRLGLLENLRRLAEAMLRDWHDRRAADQWAATYLSLDDRGQRSEIHSARVAVAGSDTAILQSRASAVPHSATTPPLPERLSDSFVVRLLQVLRDHGPAGAATTEWLERVLAERETNPADILRREHQRQAANQVSISNCVTSLRLLSALDWSVFFERTSLVEAILRDDPARVYPRQEFATRDRYRQAVEQLARGADCSELEVARRAAERARQQEPAASDGQPAASTKRGHVGFYLIGAGHRDFEAELGYHPDVGGRIRGLILDHPRLVYFGPLAAVTALILAFLAAGAWAGPAWVTGLLLVVALLPASELAVGVVNYALTLIVPPRVLPKLNFRDGIPPDCATFVVMPSMLLRPQSAGALLERLEIHYLANPDPQLRFALLTDFADAPAEHMPEDAEYVRAALEGVQGLNERYAGTGSPRFFLFHRRRQWNPVQGCWMGWERKRGKLLEFNRLLRGDHSTSFTVCSVDPALLPRIRFVITLDVDTQLPRETAQRLVGTLAHPLNQPHFDPAEGRVVEGYAILQPRVTFNLAATSRSLFARILAASAGIDPYATAVSDVYQDLFGAGSYTGKGIYDVDAFHAAVGNTFPENHILSHDLIESNYARCGLVTDIELLDDFPARYHVYARREHRWARGDWQLLPWLFPRVPAPEPNRAPASGPGQPAEAKTVRGPNPLSALERWKVLDNLRRTLVPPALVSFFVLAWTLLPGSFWWWTGFPLLVLALPLLLQLFGGLLTLIRGGSWKAPAQQLREDIPATAGQVLLSLVFLADQARLLLDAIGRTLFRLVVSRRRLLDWETAATTERRLGDSLAHFCLTMWPSPIIAAVVGAVVGWVHTDALAAAAPILGAWLLSPVVAFLVSRVRPASQPAPLTSDERHELRRIARRTWFFFERFVGEEDHWLPPDNFQEDPKGQIAHRTSPTNIGMMLLSTLAAHDFGYLTLRKLAERLEQSFATLERLERYQGHFHNWYDTRSLRSLQPGYISTVDSGNLLACFLTLKNGLQEKADEPLAGPSVPCGLIDALGLIEESLGAVTPPASPAELPEVYKSLEDNVGVLGGLLGDWPEDLLMIDERLEVLKQRAGELAAHVNELAHAVEAIPDELVDWAGRFLEQVEDWRNELLEVAPWIKLLREAEAANALSVASQPAGHSTSPLLGRWQQLRQALITPGSVADVPSQLDAWLAELKILQADAEATELPLLPSQLQDLGAALQSSGAADLLRRCQRVADRAGALGSEMNFRFLYHPERRLFAVGYNLSLQRADNAYYDLLASEACVASYLAIARGDAPRRHWFQLGRPLTRAAGRLCLLSWGGTMFEYLMPRLLLRTYPGTLLSESARAAVARHIEYGRECGVPWGISESAYGALDLAMDYHYQAFGVPGLGLKRGLGQSLVIAPYATALAVMVSPRAALENFRRLAAEGGRGRYGFYEALDYTRGRVPKGQRNLVVRTFMAHHQGMSVVALANGLLEDPMLRRFHAEPLVRSAELLLQERVPRGAPLVQPSSADEPEWTFVRTGAHPMMSRRLTTPQTLAPRTHLLSNGRYSVMVTNAGSGYSTCQGSDVTRWREDRTRDCWGQFCYIRDLRSGRVWSAGHQPLCRPADDYEVIYAADKTEFRRRDAGIETVLEITVSPENCAEVRRITLTNHNQRAHELEVTSYAEIVLATRAADLAHPAFNKLFLETEFLPAAEALLCRRRPRSVEQKPIWAVHVVAVDGPAVGDVEYETDRARFLGRGRTPAAPAALDSGAILSGTVGPVLDPVFSLRRRVRLQPAASVSVSFTTGVADTREQALALADQYHHHTAILRAFELAWAHSQVELTHLHLSPEDSHLYQRLASHVIYAGSAHRAPPSVLAANQQGLAGLWRLGISGDKPIVLVRISEMAEMALVQQLLTAHSYWRLKGLEVDLVILNEHPTGYFEELQEHLMNLCRSCDAHALIDKAGGVFLRKAAHLSEEDRVLLQAAARVVLVGSRGPLVSQVDHMERAAASPARLVITERRRDETEQTRRSLPHPAPNLLFHNGLGGFTPDGREYVLSVHAGAGEASSARGSPSPLHPSLPPVPWINVVANPNFGFLVSESGGGYTWGGNSQGNRLTPWTNDPVSDPPGEFLYLRDEATGEFWTCPFTAGRSAPEESGRRSRDAAHARATQYTVRHGQGYTVIQQESYGLRQELLVFVPAADPVKIIRLKVENLGSSSRRLSATYYAEWVLGTIRDQTAMHVVTELDSETGALLARNVFRQDFAGGVAFADVALRPRTVTADRTEFLGRNGSPAAPAALERVELSGRVGAALDPCAALQAPFELKPGETKEIVFLLGEADGAKVARQLVQRYRQPAQVAAAFDAVKARWDGVLTAVQVRTPNPAMDLLLNRWLLYQVLSCRVWGRSAFYQSGGAFGFRDQLQDVMAVVYAAPGETRAQILRAAGRQFLEGDVQHWWHPPSGRGVRTRCSDDFLWLPYVTAHYVSATGDAAVWDESAPFLRAPVLKQDQEEEYGLPEISEQTGTIYDHCVRAIDHALRFGAHGLPLIGTGDWNDGMNRVGAGGKGESVWVGWFLLPILKRFAEIAAARGDAERAKAYRQESDRLRTAIEEQAWDGGWYRRAYFDDGAPLGSAQNDECKIDSLAQSWAVISGAGDRQRAREAMNAVNDWLVRRAEKLILLFAPPFDQGRLQPGYIKGYVPGIRENGGQYTHAAVWVVLAHALLGQGSRAMGLFDLLNPIHHAALPEDVARYRVEPYVVAADIYGEPPHTGRGGWTWYTGSAAWLYRVALEALLGFQLRGDRLMFDPRIPSHWGKYTITYRHRSATYHVSVENPHSVERGLESVTLDGVPCADNVIELADDGKAHQVRVIMG